MIVLAGGVLYWMNDYYHRVLAIRNSVDHGTVFSKAGEGRANEESMLNAIDVAMKMVEYKDIIE